MHVPKTATSEAIQCSRFAPAAVKKDFMVNSPSGLRQALVQIKETDRQAETARQAEAEIERDRPTDRDRDRDRQTDKDSQTGRDRETEIERDRPTDREYWYSSETIESNRYFPTEVRYE